MVAGTRLNVTLYVTLCLFISQYLNNLMHKICFTISFISCLYMFRAHVFIIRRSKFYYTAGIVTLSRWPSGAQSTHNLCTGRPPIGVMIPDAVQYNFDLLMMSTCTHHQEVKIALHSLWYHRTVYGYTENEVNGTK